MSKVGLISDPQGGNCVPSQVPCELRGRKICQPSLGQQNRAFTPPELLNGCTQRGFVQPKRCYNPMIMCSGRVTTDFFLSEPPVSCLCKSRMAGKYDNLYHILNLSKLFRPLLEVPMSLSTVPNPCGWKGKGTFFQMFSSCIIFSHTCGQQGRKSQCKTFFPLMVFVWIFPVPVSICPLLFSIWIIKLPIFPGHWG